MDFSKSMTDSLHQFSLVFKFIIVICYVIRLLILKTLLVQDVEGCMLMLMILTSTPSQLIGKVCVCCLCVVVPAIHFLFRDCLVADTEVMRKGFIILVRHIIHPLLFS